MIRTIVFQLPAAAAICMLALINSACVCTTGICATERALRFAHDERFEQRLLEGAGLQHTVFIRDTPGDALWIFIDGDGSPWIEGATISDDPTARNPLALRLAAQTPGTVAYLGRPCYLDAIHDARCSSAMWTSDRYSNAVIDSMSAATQALLRATSQHSVVLVGHSGGGTLAVLMAKQLPEVKAVITIAGNLDVVEWTRQHGYLPLNGRNPADEEPLPSSVAQLHLVGLRDTTVSSAMSARYLDRIAPTQVWREAGFDHACCWEQAWSKILQRAGELDARFRLP